MSVKKIVILFSGEGGNLEVLIKKLHKKSFADLEVEVLAAITNNPKANGIKKAQKLGIKVIVLDHKKHENREAYDLELVDAIKSLGADLSVFAGFMRIVTRHFTHNIKSINIHPSLLPAYRGADALKRSFEGKEKVAGVTSHFVVEELDAGEIILQKSFEKEGLSFEEYKKKIHECEYEIYYRSVLKALS